MSGRLPAPRSFPLAGPAAGRLAFATGEASVRDALLSILLTRPGERLMRPAFGAGVQRFVHQPADESTRRLIADVVRAAVVRHEPRIALEGVDVEPDPADAATLRVTVRWRMRHDGGTGALCLSLPPSS